MLPQQTEQLIYKMRASEASGENIWIFTYKCHFRVNKKCHSNETNIPLPVGIGIA